MTEHWDKERLDRALKARQRRDRTTTMGSSIQQFLKKQVQPRMKKFAVVSQAWEMNLPEELVEHTCIESFRGGQLNVLVDSSSHQYELNLMLKEGLLDALREMCPNVSIRKIKVTYGTWYRRDDEGSVIPVFKK